MTVKVYSLEFTITAGSTWTRLASLITPAGKTRKLIEIRPYFSVTGDAKIRIYHETEYIGEISAETVNTYKLPYPQDVEVPAGTGIYIEGSNAGSSDSKVIVELVVDETT